MAATKKKAPRKVPAKKSANEAAADNGRTRTARPYPASSFSDALALGDAIMKFASGDRVRRLTLLGQMDKSPTSGPTKMMITNSGKYGITTGSYAAEHLELTEKGRTAVDSSLPQVDRRRAAFDLAINGVAPFKVLYDHYKDKRLPEREVMKDVLRDSSITVPDLDECVDTFTVNVKDLDLLRTIGGAETLVSIDQVLEELARAGPSNAGAMSTSPGPTPPASPSIVKRLGDEPTKASDWQHEPHRVSRRPVGLSQTGAI